MEHEQNSPILVQCRTISVVQCTKMEVFGNFLSKLSQLSNKAEQT